MWDRMAASWRRDWRLFAAPSVVFAGLVFVGGMLPVSPFATWPNWVLYLLLAPAVAGWVWVIYRGTETLTEVGVIGDGSKQEELTPERKEAWNRWLQITLPGWHLKVFIGLSLVFMGWLFVSDIAAEQRTPPSASDEGAISAESERQMRLEKRTDGQRGLGSWVFFLGLMGLVTVDDPESFRKARQELGDEEGLS